MPSTETIAAIQKMCQTSDPAAFFSALEATGFSAETYRDANADLKSLTLDAAAAHFLCSGVRERRLFPIDLQAEAVGDLCGQAAANAAYVTEVAAALTGAFASTNANDATIPMKMERLSRLGHFGCKPFLLIGDSHSNLYRRSPTRGSEWIVALHVLCTAGSANGLRNPNSRSGYGERIRRIVSSLAEGPSPILLQFGQVDTEFVYNFKRVRDGRARFDRSDYEAYCATTAEGLVGYLCDIFPRSEQRQSVGLLSIFPPALSDEKWAEGYANGHIVHLEAPDSSESAMAEAIRRLEIPDLPTRTSIHSYYNARLERLCQQHGFRYADGFSPFLGTGEVLDPRFITDNKGANHHLEFSPAREAAEAVLWNAINP